MRLMHYSDAPVSEIVSKDQIDRPNRKPRGFWVSVEGEDDWPSWCRSEDFGLSRLTHGHEVILADSGKLLRIGSVSALDDFHREFTGPHHFGSYCDHLIHWDRVANKYDGIIIAPYRWERRLDGPYRS